MNKWIDPIAIVWVFFISIVFLMPPYSISAPWKDGFTWEAVNYAPILVGGALLLFGGWWILSAKNWFKGPVRMGTEEELERMEEESLGKHYKWIDAIAIVWVFFISLVFLMPPYSISAPWKDGFTWEAVNYAPLLVGGAILLFGGWWILSAKNWFKGPVRMGTDEELERLEEQQLTRYEVPTET